MLSFLCDSFTGTEIINATTIYPIDGMPYISYLINLLAQLYLIWFETITDINKMQLRLFVGFLALSCCYYAQSMNMCKYCFVYSDENLTFVLLIRTKLNIAEHFSHNCATNQIKQSEYLKQKIISLYMAIGVT